MLTYQISLLGLSNYLIAEMGTTSVQEMVPLADLGRVQFLGLAHAKHNLQWTLTDLESCGTVDQRLSAVVKTCHVIGRSRSETQN